MPILVAWLGEMLLSVIGQLVLSAVVSLGIGFVASHAASGLIDYSGIRARMTGAGPLFQYVGWLGIDQAMTIVLSAWAGRKVVDAARVHLTSKRAAS